MPVAKSLLLYFILTITTLLLFVCDPVKSCSHGEIRLVNVVGAYQGSLEVCVAGRWNGVCDDDGDSMNQTAAVACRQNGCGVGHTEAGSLCSEHRFKFQCSGHEANLTSCDVESSSNCSLNGNSTMCVNVHCMFCPAPVSLLPYGESVGDLRVPSLLDTSSGPINLTQNFPFFGSEESTIFVVTHGLLSFRSAYIEYSQQPLPINNTVPLILLFWRDTDIRDEGQIFYREVSSIESQTMTLARYLLPPNANNFNPISIFIATWNQVPPTSGLDGRNNTYQVVLMTDGWRSYVCLLYSRIQWGPRAQIGFNAGYGNRSFTVPGGLTGATLHMESFSNVGRPGLFVYQVDGDEVGASSPTQLIVIQAFQTSLQLRWTNTHSDGVDHFNVYCYHTSCSYCSHLPAVHTVTTSSTTATITGLTPYTEYGCCVTAVNLNQESDCSEELNISTLPVLPTRPVDVGITELTSTSFKLEWSRPLHIDGTLLYYQITCLQSLNNVWLSTTVNSSVDVSNLQPFTNYTCCISATNQAGEGSSACSDAKTADLQVAGSQINFVTAVSAGVLSAFLVILALVTICITCCCCYKRRMSKKVTLQN